MDKLTRLTVAWSDTTHSTANASTRIRPRIENKKLASRRIRPRIENEKNFISTKTFASHKMKTMQSNTN